MSVRDAKAPVVAVAGVAIVGLFVGGMIFRSSRGHAPTRPLDKPVLVGRAPHWTDGYNHFILTMAAPVPPVADKSTAGALFQGAGRRPAQTRTAGAAPGAGVEPPAAPPAIEASLTAKVIRTAKAAGSAARGLGSQWGLPWQAVVPDSSDPIVLRPGQPVSELLKALAHCPKGTKLERDDEGNVRAVPPRGSHCSLPESGRSGGAGPGSRPSTKLPDGLQPDSRAIVASLLAVPGVHAAAPVWGDRYQVVTHLTAAQVKALPGVAAVAPNNLLAAFSATPPQAYDPEFGDEYYLANDGRALLTDVGTAGASSNFAYGWARSRGGGVVIADIDTGVDLSNPDLAGRILPQSRNYSVTPANNDVQASGTATGFYHATTVDGVMVGVAGNGWGGAGAAPEARILALKCGDSSSLSDSCIYASGEYAIAEKQAGVNVKIVNLSFGEQASSDSTLYSLMTDLQTAGILVTASAGNFGTDNDSAPVLPAGYSTQFDNVISVGATDNADQLASYSDFGATTVDIMAPGSDMFTDYPTYSGYANAYVSGTSYAAPMAAAAAALLWSADPSLSYKQVMSDIMNSAQPVPALAVECVSGGRLDVPAALADVVEPVQFSFGGFDEMSTAGVSDVVVGASAQAGALPAGTALGFHVELAYNYNGTMYDVADDPVGWSLGASGAQSATTATDGTTFISPGGMTSATFGQHPLLLVLGNPPASDPGAAPGLASGTYALVIYAATAAAPATPIGSPQAVFFNVGAASPTPSVTTTTSSAVGDSTTSGPVTTSGTGGATTSTIPWTTIGSTPIPSISQSPGTSAAATTTTGATATTAATTSTTAAATTTTAAKAATSTTAAPTTTTAAATTTTAAPTTTAATTTTTTAAATTTTTAATTTTTAATTTTSNATTTSTTASFSIDSIAPPILAATGGSVSIFGNNLPPNPAVTVGGVGAAVQDATSSEIDVLVGAMTPGNYTVTVYNAAQTESASSPSGLTIGTVSGTTSTTSAGSGGSTTTTAKTTTTAAATTTTGAATTTTGAATTTTAAATTTTAGAATTTAAPGGGATTTTSAATTTSPSTTAATTTTAALATTTTGPGGTIGLPNGMTLAPPAAADPLDNVGVGEWGAFTASQINADNGAVTGTAVDGVDIYQS